MPAISQFWEEVYWSAGTQPLFWPLVLWLPIFLGLRAGVVWPVLAAPGKRMRCFWPVAGVVAVLLFVWFLGVFARSPIYTDHGQPLVAAASWYLWQGRPVYGGPPSAEVYTIPYGPYLYVITALIEWALAPGVLASKIGSVLAAVATVLFVSLAVRQRAGRAAGLAAGGLVVAFTMALGVEEFLVRADFYLTALVAAGWCVAQFPGKWAPVALGVMIGVATDLKLHGGVYFLPLAWVAFRAGHRWPGLLAAGLAAFLVAMAPFGYAGGFSLSNYIQVLQDTSKHGLIWQGLGAVSVWLAGAILPLGLMVALALRQQRATALAGLCQCRWLLGLVLAEFLIVAIPAAKPGAGVHHLLPLVLLLPAVAAELWHAGVNVAWSTNLTDNFFRAALLSWLVVGLGYGAVRSWQMARWLGGRQAWGEAVVADIGKIMRDEGGDHTLLMGVGADTGYDMSFFRPLLVFAGQPIGIDPVPVMDLQEAGYATPPLSRLLDQLQTAHPGRDILWLVPKGQAPFSMHSYYTSRQDPHRPTLYDESFQAEFSRDFALKSSTEFYDVYGPRTGSSTPSGQP